VIDRGEDRREKLEISRADALRWMMESPDNIIEYDAYSNCKHYNRWKDDMLWFSTDGPGGEYKATTSTCWLYETEFCAFRRFRKFGSQPVYGRVELEGKTYALVPIEDER